MVWNADTDEEVCRAVEKLEVAVQGGGCGDTGAMGRGTGKTKH
jgi:hypothetical protein